MAGWLVSVCGAMAGKGFSGRLAGDFPSRWRDYGTGQAMRTAAVTRISLALVMDVTIPPSTRFGPGGFRLSSSGLYTGLKR